LSYTREKAAILRVAAAGPPSLSRLETLSCQCGAVVIDDGELDPETALCFFCAGSGHDLFCACFECSVYRERGGAGPTEAIDFVIRSAAMSAGSGSR
jgi:hypothetical protein